MCCLNLQTHVFLEALCDEYARCEVVFAEVLPGLHKKWDTDGDSFLTLKDVTQMMRHMAPAVSLRVCDICCVRDL